MLTLHAADLLIAVPGTDPVPGGAVVVDGDTVAALGPYEELTAAYPRARVRRWPGVITPGLRQWHGAYLLTRAYHPDPREYEELGDRPLTGERLTALDMTGTRWAGSVRRGVQQMLRHGTTAVAIGSDPVVSTAVARSGLTVVSPLGAPGILLEEPNLDPFRNAYGLADAVASPLTVGGRADLAVFDVPDVPDALDEAALLEAGAGTCVATVLAGRLVHRRR
ncbi:imidazolonepropionase-like domain-containing protein [Streptomyces sp. NPDC000405]|uniref:imidazolonepropionase-like domain-containing protein n=1 Tax=Streptomyces sp. NPDC000405 TaxID=3161033 RepID=UPI00398D363C